MAKFPALRIAGVMSGTSLDGVDVVLCRCTPDSVERLHQGFRPFPRALVSRMHAAARGDASGWEVAQLHHDLGRTYARQVAEVLAGERCQAIALHGQTIFHQPDGPAAATFQLGEPAYLAEALGLPVVSNFRVGDLAAGGQGAPLATLFHQVAFARPGRFIAVQNLGGIGNVTALDWTDARRKEPAILAFDTGPANVLLDLAARHLSEGRRTCDRDGRMAAKGTVNVAALSRWLQHPYFRRRPPKSTGRELFGEPFFQTVLAEWPQPLPDSGPDLLATLTEFTAQSVALDYRRHLPGAAVGLNEVILAGGGGLNPFLRERLGTVLRTLAPEVEVVTTADLGWPAATVEAAAFALLGAYRIWGLPGNLPGTTGATGPRLLGSVTPAAGSPG